MVGIIVLLSIMTLIALAFLFFLIDISISLSRIANNKAIAIQIRKLRETLYNDDDKIAIKKFEDAHKDDVDRWRFMDQHQDLF